MFADTKMKKGEISTWLLGAAAVASTIYLLLLGWYNVLSLDDYGSIADVENMGLIGFSHDMYMSWQGRWSAFFVDGIYYKIWGRASNLITFTIFQLIIGYATVYCLLRKLFVKRILWETASTSVLFVNLAILALQEISTFYWLCCPHYILCVWAFIWLYYLLFLLDQSRWWHVICIVLLSLYLSGIAETITPLVIMVFGLRWLYNIIVAKRHNMFKLRQDRNLTYSLIFLSVGFLAMVMAPGNSTRINSMSTTSMVGNFTLSIFIVKWCRATIVLGLRFISKSLYYISIAIIAAWLGYKHQDNSQLASMVWDGKKIIYVTLALAAFFAISVAPCVYAMGWYAPTRSFSYMSFVLTAYFVWIGSSIGNNIKRPIIIECANILVAVSLCICSFGWIVREQPALAAYNGWVKKCQTEICRKVREGDKTPYMIQNSSYPAELNTYATMRNALNKMLGSSRTYTEYQYPYMMFIVDEDPLDWKNQGLGRYYHVDFEITAYDKQ